MRPKGLMLVLSAPSGGGKTTLARRLLAAEPGGCFSISVTTRAPRGGEIDGVDYTFVDQAAFDELRERDQLLEWAQVHGATYGTPAHYAAEANDHGRLVVFDIDWQGGLQIKRRHPEAATVLILPPSPEELSRRLRSRATDSEEAILRRLEVARAEIDACLEHYDYVVINDRLDDAYQDLSAIVRSLRGEGSEADEGRAAGLRLDSSLVGKRPKELIRWERGGAQPIR